MDKKVKALNLEKLPIKLAASALLWGALGFLMGKGRLFGFSGTFPLALICSREGRIPTLSSAAGALLGGIIRQDISHVIGVVLTLIFRVLGGIFLDSSEKKSKTIGDGIESVRDRLRRITDIEFAESKLFRLCLSSAIVMLSLSLRILIYGYEEEFIMGSVFSSLAAPVITYLYSFYKASNVRKTAVIGICALAASAVLGLRGTDGFSFLALPAAYIFSLFATRRYGTLCGSMCAVVCSAMISPMICPAFASAAAVAGVLWKYSPYLACAGACSTSVAVGVYFLGFSALDSFVPSVIIASAVSVPLCSLDFFAKSARKSKVPLRETGKALAEEVRNTDTAEKTLKISQVMSEISKSLIKMTEHYSAPDTSELCRLVEETFEKCCENCGMKSACFGKEATQTGQMQTKMTLELRNSGRVSAVSVPRSLALRCYSMSGILDRLNSGYRRLIAESKIYDRTAVVAADYEVISSMLAEVSSIDIESRYDRYLSAKVDRVLRENEVYTDEVALLGDRMKKVVARGVNIARSTVGSEDIRRYVSGALGVPMSQPEFSVEGSSVSMKLCALPRRSVLCGRASIALSSLAKKDDEDKTRIFDTSGENLGKTVCADSGDIICAFRSDDGHFYMLISDGMGTGKEAAMTSGLCAIFMEKFLRAGLSMDVSLKMLNSILRSREGECSATIDLMELDLMNGQVRFVKSGAAPSFVLRGGRLFRLQSKTVPIGIIRALDAEMIKFDTEVGDVIVMLSDGVARSFEDCPWLYDTLCLENEKGTDAETFARNILKEAIKNGASDDITAGVVVVK